MLQSVEIRNFQSLHDVALDLAPLTVVVGPSSSGKSAFVRALRTLANNRRGLDFLTHGQRLCTITARNEHSTITLSRGKGTEENYYEVIPAADPNSAPAAPQRWSKLGGAVPEEVSAALGIPQGAQSFAAQHDMPYLLNDSPSSVAVALGRLTNVNVIFDAAREAKRQAMEASRTIKLRAADLESASSTLDRFEHLDEQQHALSRAEEKISQAYSAQRDLNAITVARDALIAAAGAVKRLRTAAEVEIPDVYPVQQLQNRIGTILDARDALMMAAESVRARRDVLSVTQSEQDVLNAERQNLRDNTENIFRERFEQSSAATANYAGEDGSVKWWDIDTEAAAKIAAQTVEELSA